MDLSRWTDEQLLVELSPDIAGPAFATFYRRHERLVAAFHLRRVKDPDIAADLTAETFAQALASRERFVARGRTSGARWLFGIARNVLGYHARQAVSHQRRCEEFGITRRGLTGEQRSELAVLATEDGAMRALAQLPEEQREAIRAYVLEDQDYAAIAATTGDPEPTIRKRVSRGLAALRRDVKEPR